METASPALDPQTVLRIARESRASGFRARTFIDGNASGFVPISTVRTIEPQIEAPAPAPAPEVVPEPEVAKVVDPIPVPEAVPDLGFDDGYAKGLADGIDQGKAEAEARVRAEIQETAQRLGQLIEHLADPARVDLSALNAALHQAVIGMAAQRAGQAITDLPQPFLDRIDRLAEQVAHGQSDITIRLHPDDLAAVRPHLGLAEFVTEARFVADPRLLRGDVVIRAGGVFVEDRLEAVE